MPSERSMRKEAYMAKQRMSLEISLLRGCGGGGNCFCIGFVIKGQEDLKKQNFSALKASLEHLGYAPECMWATLLTSTKQAIP